MRKISFTIIALLASVYSYAGGFQVLLQGVRQTGMGNTGSALADISNLYYNPGSAAMAEKDGVSVGANAVLANIAYVSESFQKAESKNPTGTPFYLAAQFSVSKDKKLKVGFSVTTPFGSSVKWEDEWAGRTYLKSISLSAITIQPTIGYKINDKLGIGIGFQYVLGRVELKRSIAIPVNGIFADTELDGKSKGYGFNIGVNYKATEKLTVALSYRSKVTSKVDDGKAYFSNIPSGFPAPVQAGLNLAFPNAVNGTIATSFKSELPLPAVATLGLSYLVNENLLVNVDARYTFWNVYKSLDFEFGQKINGSTTSSSPRNYNNAFAAGIGAEYKVNKLRVRAGGYYDQTPVQDGYMTAETPDQNTVYLSGGLGYRFNDLISIDASVLYGNKSKRENKSATYTYVDAAGATQTGLVGPNGSFATKIIVPSIAVNFNF